MRFDLKEFSYNLKNSDFICSIEYFEEIDSTNSYLKNLNDIHKKLVIADFQTAGRGRFERKWISNKGENLTFSFGLANLQVKLVQKLSFFVPVIIAKAIENLFEIQLEIKWPNDLLFDGKKFCGILIESIFENKDSAKSIIGIGINCNQVEFPEDISTRTTSLKIILNKEISREKLLAKIFDEFATNWENFQTDFNHFYNEYKSRCKSIGKQISVYYNHEIYKGVFDDINENGELILKCGMKNIIFQSGEVTILKG